MHRIKKTVDLSLENLDVLFAPSSLLGDSGTWLGRRPARQSLLPPRAQALGRRPPVGSLARHVRPRYMLPRSCRKKKACRFLCRVHARFWARRTRVVPPWSAAAASVSFSSCLRLCSIWLRHGLSLFYNYIVIYTSVIIITLLIYIHLVILHFF
jgi:hypothetical protein